MGVAGGSAIGNHGHGFACCVGRVHFDFDVQHRGEATQTLSTNAQGVDLFIQLQAQVFNLGELVGAFGGFFKQLVHVQVVHEAFFGHEHCFFGGATNANAQHPGWAPARAHGGHSFKNPVHHGVAGVEHDHFAFVLAAAAFGCHGDF